MLPILMPDGRPGSSKATWRDLGRARRAALSDREQDRRDRGWERTGFREVRRTGAGTVALYLSRPGEPATVGLAARLAGAGLTVLAPVLTDGAGHGIHDPAWARFDADRLRDGLWGIPEPDGPVLGPDALIRADLVICSAIWVDRNGHRVGTGGGWYDRALAGSGYRSGGGHRLDSGRHPVAPVWAMVDESEVVPALPHDRWDIRVDAALTPSGLLPLAVSEAATPAERGRSARTCRPRGQ